MHRAAPWQTLVQQDSLYTVILLGQTDVVQQVVQTYIVLRLTPIDLTHEHRHRVGVAPLLDQHALHLQPIDGVLLNLGLLVGEHTAEHQAEHHAQAYIQERTYDDCPQTTVVLAGTGLAFFFSDK